ncbi:GumC domain-containing protein [Thermospira aquatica]|uniref:Uncharacterized protein n=1 Tax=Thermospira aquatica TaxID=2828656 RepID=A0AAX3BCD0_9SPIR|nr:hypothetical protein [Thermospira aquatica]URA09936.1 hypothetical protein KDW03_10715 [Thermospira aquatica]
MDHDKQITQWIHDPKSYFLAEDIAYEGERPPLYILEEEFAKTKKNRPYFLYFIMFLVSVVVVAFSLFVTKWYREKASKIEVQVADFQDLNLKEVLASYAKSLDELSQAKFELDALRQEYRDFQARVRQRRLQEELLLEQQDLSEEEKLTRLAQIATNAQQELKKLDEKYLPQIEEKQKRVAELEQTSSQYQKEVKGAAGKMRAVDDTRQVYEARLKQQQEYYQNQLNEQKRRYEREKEDLKKYYEKLMQTIVMRYNPLFTTQELQEALQYRVDIKTPLPVWADVIKQHRLGFSVDELYRQVRYQETIMKRLLLVPYTNSVALAIPQVYRLSLALRNEYENLGKVVGGVLSEREQLWKRINDGLVRVARERGEIGLVISSQQPALVVIDPIYAVKTGDIGYIFRQDSQMIAKVQFRLSNYQSIFVEPIEWYDTKKEFQVFDRVVLKLRGE